MVAAQVGRSQVRVLVVNPGSSSLKLGILDADDAAAGFCDIGCVEGAVDSTSLEEFVASAPPTDAAGVRLVHGGAAFRQSVVVDDANLADLHQVADLAPLHNPPALDAVEVLRRRLPGISIVACFDTAFHRTLPPAAATYAVPWEWTQRWGIRRYGFHGLSHAYASRRAADLLGSSLDTLRLVTCHLGAGASLAAVDGGVSVDTTMGFTPLEGLVMATRSGSLDPGIVFWAQRHLALEAAAVERLLERESGLLGLSGVSEDMREVLAAADRGNERARLALNVYVHRLRGGVAAMASAMGGLHALIFTGGVGENSAVLRRETCRGLGFLGLAIDPERNDGVGDRDISPPDVTARVLAVHAREDLEIARETRALLADDGHGLGKIDIP